MMPNYFKRLLLFSIQLRMDMQECLRQKKSDSLQCSVFQSPHSNKTHAYEKSVNEIRRAAWIYDARFAVGVRELPERGRGEVAGHLRREPVW